MEDPGSADLARGPLGPRRWPVQLLVDAEAFEVEVRLPAAASGDPMPQRMLVEIDPRSGIVAARAVHALHPAPSPTGATALDGEPNPPDPATAPAAGTLLSTRELQVLEQLTKGASNKSIARSLGISAGTVRVHVKSLLRKLELDNRTQAAVWAIATGFGVG
jgi:two-component system nitrate/nitrite response regulator NarL